MEGASHATPLALAIYHLPSIQIQPSLNNHNFTRMQGYDIMEDIYSTKTAAMNFLHELCKARAKGNLDMLMQVRLLACFCCCFLHETAP